MSELKSFDDNVFDDDDEWETPRQLFESLCKKYNINPKLDVCATPENKKCASAIFQNSLEHNWILPLVGNIKNQFVDVWCNPPHSKNEEFVRKAYSQWQKHNINIMMIIPTNTMSSKFWHECIEGTAEYHAVEGRPRFLRYGKPAKFNSRNAYVCVVFRKK